MAGRIQRNRRFRGRRIQRGQRPFWHTSLLAKSSVLYLYSATGCRERKCAPFEGAFSFPASRSKRSSREGTDFATGEILMMRRSRRIKIVRYQNKGIRNAEGSIPPWKLQREIVESKPFQISCPVDAQMKMRGSLQLIVILIVVETETVM